MIATLEEGRIIYGSSKKEGISIPIQEEIIKVEDDNITLLMKKIPA